MDESNFHKADKTNHTELTKIRLNRKTEIENCFQKKINQRKSCSKKLNKYVAAFDYIDKILIVLGATTGGVSIFFVDEHLWSSCRNSKCKFFFSFFSNNKNSQKNY